MSLEWMAWSVPTAIFFVGIFTMLVAMIFISIRWPSRKRKGFLPISTTRGERLYIGLIITFMIIFVWLAATDATVLGAVAICVTWLFVVMRWG